ncbi:MAG TPA: DegV family protein [Haploplasma sp.]|nr:DegV family protein [Haploplasma sp.]
MRKVGFVIDSTFTFKTKDISVVPLKVIIDDAEHVEGQISNDLVVDALKNNRDLKTSQPTPNSFVEAYEHQLSLGYEHVICLTISSTLSGTINGANVAKDIVDNEKITVIDTQSASVGATAVLENALAYAETGKSVEEVIAYINESVKKGSVIFSVDNLSTLVKNGRLSKVSAFIGGLLRVKPILRFKEGVLTVESKARGILGVFKYITAQVAEMVEKHDVVVRITYVDNLAYAEEMEKSILDLNNDKIDVQVRGIVSTVMAAHIGLGGMGIYLGVK